MARLWQTVLLLALVLLVVTPRIARAQLTDLPDLTTGDDSQPDPTDADDAPTPTDADDAPTPTDANDEPTPTDDGNEPATTDDGDDVETTADGDSTPTPTDDEDNTPTQTDDSDEPTSTDDDDDDSTTTDAPETTDAPTTTDGDEPTSTNDGFSLTSAPTIAGAGIPELFIPWTGNAPFMQKSTLPEGTVFIAVGAVLAFLGAAVLLWHSLVAWSINRSVKRAATASMRGSEKNTRGPGGGSSTTYNPRGHKSHGVYRDADRQPSSTLSLDALTSAGKKPYLREHTTERAPSPPEGLFFSPTTQAANRNSTLSQQTPGGNRGSQYMPSGFYASPNSSTPHATTLGGNLAAPQPNRHSSYNPSPPPSPGLPPTARPPHTRRTNSHANKTASHSRTGSRDGPGGGGGHAHGSNRNSALDPGYGNGGSARHSGVPGGNGNGNGFYSGANNSSLMMVGGASTPDLGGGRVPSAYLEDLFENHGNGLRERF